ncbi:MAG TPA: CocE/NonD family hydrolase [Fimbriimonas sp.]|nr:CocE/NonD family hydrolase [Fimbriimonas sp.]
MLASIALAAAFQSEPVISEIYLGDTLAGSNTLVQSPNGESTSKSSFTIQGFLIDSTATMTVSKGQILKLTFSETMSQNGKVVQSGEASFADGTGSIKQSGGAPRTLKATPTFPLFTNFHPQYLKGLADKIDFTKASPQTVKLFMLEAAQEISIVFTPKKSRTVDLGSTAPTIRYVDVSIGELKSEMAFSENGDYLGMFVPSQKLTIVLRGYKGVFSDPLSKFPELSQPTHKTERIETKFSLRDGTETTCTVVKPTTPGKYPVILNRTPYGRELGLTDADMYASRGYVFVSQDVRGTSGSNGKFDPFVNERKDGYDSIDWVSKQNWSNGNVGMIGASYGGYVQWAAAVELHPALKCIVPQVSPPVSAMWNIPYERGVPILMSDLWWLRIVDNPEGQNMLGAMNAVNNLKKMVTLPIKNVDNAVLGFNSKIFDTWMARDNGSKWSGFHFEDELKNVKIPALHISGWFDGDEIGTQRNWDFVTKAGNKSQRLIYGPWPHAFNSTRRMLDVDFGADAILELDSVYIRWFDHWLKGKAVNAEMHPAVMYFVMGENKWRTSSAWPPAEATKNTLYANFGSKSIGDKSTATLTPNKPTKLTKASTTYDPKKDKVSVDSIDPSATTGTAFVEGKELSTSVVLRSAPFTRDTVVTSKVTFTFDFTCSAKDTDFFVMALDEGTNKKYFPAFRPAKLRASYLNSVMKQTPLVPGKKYRASMELWDSAHQFKKGHRLTIVLAQSLFPSTARNLGTAEPILNATKSVTQKVQLLSSPSSPATLTFYTVK